jgi:hypothetical protein
MFVTSWNYILENYQAADCLAVVIKSRDRLIQRIATTEQVASKRFQAWLRYENAHGGNIYVSMNPLKPDAHGRTKQDIAVVRHIYLDLDQGGACSLIPILMNIRLPLPSYVLGTSIGKYQVVWKVEGFGIAEAERLQKAMAIKYNADRAATDVTRVLRIPGFYNPKYSPPHRVIAWKLSDLIFHPSDFPVEPHLDALPGAQSTASKIAKGMVSQSEQDWAETLCRLDQGEDPLAVLSWLEQNSQDKPNPKYYAALTVGKALLKREGWRVTNTDFDLSR